MFLNPPETEESFKATIDELVRCCLADDNSLDQVFDADGQIHFNSQAIQRARLRIDTRKWLACKLVPKVYGQSRHENVRDLSLVEKLINDLEL